jgi:hypothetical protein
MTDQAMLAEMARLLAVIERYWSTHFRAGDEIDAFTIQQGVLSLLSIGKGSVRVVKPRQSAS